ncbi:PP0621 family protein [Plasticicumulans acidivorans]|uniref:PP0621 family protein n=1 Tax=Plasticicumulans acidivorans TaxID=886464 RepID=UPI002482FB1F|nr:PP0621 family protein [Plasticicumulans acidivorans]
MLKLLLLFLLVAAIWWWWKRRWQRPSIPMETPPAYRPMVRCAHCGLHFPASQAVRDAAGDSYCCKEHRALGRNPS